MKFLTLLPAFILSVAAFANQLPATPPSQTGSELRSQQDNAELWQQRFDDMRKQQELNYKLEKERLELEKKQLQITVDEAKGAKERREKAERDAIEASKTDAQRLEEARQQRINELQKKCTPAYLQTANFAERSLCNAVKNHSEFGMRLSNEQLGVHLQKKGK